jgi:3-dehydroquinate synthase
MPSVADLSSKQVIDMINRDKKIKEGKLHFVLPSSIGTTIVVDDVTTRQINAALKRLGLRP